MRNLERGWGILRSVSPSVHSNALKKKKNGICGGPILRSIRGFIPSNDSGTCRSNGEKPCRSIRPRKVFGKCFPKCFVHRVWYRFPKKLPILLPFFFFPLSLFFPSNSVERNIRIPMNPFRVPKIEKSMFRGGKEKKKKGKKQIEGKRFHRRISRIGRVRNVFETCSYNTSRPNRGFYLLFTEFIRHPPNV